MSIFLIIYIFIIGLLVGSFANVVIFRLPEGRSVVFPRSACGSCQRNLGVIDLIPVFSWLFLRGKCRTCDAKISIRYPLVELGMGIGFALLAIFFPILRYGVQTLAPLLLLFAVLLIIAMIDIDTMLLPDVLIMPSILIALLATFFYHAEAGLPHFTMALQGAGAAAGILVLINRVGGLVLRRFADTKERLPIGMDHVNLAALGGALGGWWLGLALALLSVLLNLVSKRIWRLPEPILYVLWVSALALSIYNPLGIQQVLLGTVVAAGWVALLAGAYWWILELSMDAETKAAYEADVENDPAADEPVAMGFGDVKLMGVIGAMLGVSASIVGILFAIILGAVGGIIGRFLGGDKMIPFAPYLVLGAWIALLVAHPFITWYLQLLGL